MNEADDTSSRSRQIGKDETGKRYTRLLVLEHVGSDKHHNKVYRCQCDCGELRNVSGNDLRTGNTKSCGCLSRENSAKRLIKHGLADTPEYLAWRALRNRCYREKDEHFARYGGRGITVCDEWKDDFATFYAHVGPRPSPLHSIHRVENNKNYEPGNVVWATKEEQANLRSTSHFIEYRGQRKTIAQWAREVGLGERTIWYRLRHGWTTELALETPPLKLKRKMST